MEIQLEPKYCRKYCDKHAYYIWKEFEERYTKCVGRIINQYSELINIGPEKKLYKKILETCVGSGNFIIAIHFFSVLSNGSVCLIIDGIASLRGKKSEGVFHPGFLPGRD